MQAVVTLLVGVLVTPVLQLLKKSLGLSGDTMRVVAAVFSFAGGIVAMLPTFLTQGVTITTIFLGGTSLVAVSEMVYRAVHKKFGWESEE
jgi:hypothetical protein